MSDREIEYEDVAGAYLAERRLQKSAGALLLWGLGVGYVISPPKRRASPRSRCRAE